MVSKAAWDKWHVLEKDRITIASRDKNCVYCHVKFNNNSSRLKETVEHIDNDTWEKNPPLVTDVAICCWSCNSSKGDKKLFDWLESDYCKKKNITKYSVANIVKQFIEENEKIKSIG